MTQCSSIYDNIYINIHRDLMTQCSSCSNIYILIYIYMEIRRLDAPLYIIIYILIYIYEDLMTQCSSIYDNIYTNIHIYGPADSELLI